MKRREFITLITGILVGGRPLAARAQQASRVPKMPAIPEGKETDLKLYGANGGGVAIGMEALALQLPFLGGSESMDDHDSGSDDWWCVG
jgi:hypothetical protein